MATENSHSERPEGRPPSPNPQICRWGFHCTKSFLSGTALLQHVIVEHVRKAVPVPLDSIPGYLRAAEGIGESYDTEHFLSLPSHTGEVSSQQKNDLSQDSNLSAPAASLPSPPTSLASRHLDDNEDETGSLSSHNGSPRHRQERLPSPQFYESDDDMDPNNLPNIPPQVLLSDSRDHHSPPSFSFLDAPSGSPRPGSIPPSPTFSDILAASTQKGAKPQDTQSTAPPVSQESSSSSESCAMIAEQLTPQDDDDDDEEDELEYAEIPQTQEDDLYRGELDWESQRSQAQASSSHAPLHAGTQSQTSPKAPSLRITNLNLGAVPKYGELSSRRPSSHLPIEQNSALSDSPPLRTASFEAPRTSSGGKQVWYGSSQTRKRSHGSAISPVISPVESPVLAPSTTTAGSSSKTSLYPNWPPTTTTTRRMNDDASQSAFHRKRPKLDASDEGEKFSSSRDRGLAYNHLEQTQMESEIANSQPARSQSQSQSQMHSQYEMYDYPLQTQAPYQSQFSDLSP